MVASVDIVNPSVVHRPQLVWCIQQFSSRLNDVAVCLLSRGLTAKKKVDCNAAVVNVSISDTCIVALFAKEDVNGINYR